MISPDEIRKKALTHWNSQRFLRADLRGETIFPLFIRFKKVSSRQMLEDFPGVRRWITRLKDHAGKKRGGGYHIIFREINHRTLGVQAVPDKIAIQSREAFLGLIGRQGEYDTIIQGCRKLLAAQPGLEPLVMESPLLVLKYAPVLPGLLKVCRHFQTHPRPNRYIRELDIPGVDTKFIETHKAILTKMLDLILPGHAIRTMEPRTGKNAFERRYYLKYDQPLIRFRLLDRSIAATPHLGDISTPLDQFAACPFPVKVEC